MVMKKDRRKADIKSKLVAAIAMLMVSCIMVVSSTYAWFTLSTAPEVTGISTAIGANGNLEMALLPGVTQSTTYTTVSDALNAIGNATGNLTVVERNTTWGNLVDLSDSGYGLNQISLYPAKLAVTEGAEGSADTISDYFLGTPQYGSDGRFTGLSTSGSAAIYNNGSFGTNSFGVRAVGTSSGMSAHELAFRDALSSANDAFNRAINQTKTGASQGGTALAGLAVTKATEANATYDQTDIASLVTAYTNVDASLDYIETALKQYIIAYALSHGGYTDTDYLAALNAMQGMSLSAMGSYAGNSGLDGYITTLTTLQSKVETTLTALNGMTGDSYQWTDISAYVSALADVDKMKLNGEAISYYMEKDGEGNFTHLGELTSNMANLILEVNASGNADTGIYAQLADFVDDFSAPVTIDASYGGLTVSNLAATMKVYASANPAYLPAAKTAANTYDAGTFGTGGTSISDFYGYIIDLAFRTNAADSALQLQTEAVDRVYDDNEGGQTMGHGSSMTFSIQAGTGYTTDKLENLMSYIRVVFFDPTSNTILGYARLDADTASVTGDETNGFSVTMYLRMWDESANDGGTWASSDAITNLVQNTPTAVSTLVYLDGEKLTNADVANAELTGTMNIQFSSSADLVPMEYGDLRNGNAEEQSEYTVTVNGTTASQKVAAGATYTLKQADYADLIPDGKTVASVTVTMGGTEVVGAYDPTTGDITVTNVSGDIVVNVTFTETTG